MIGKMIQKLQPPMTVTNTYSFLPPITTIAFLTIEDFTIPTPIAAVTSFYSLLEGHPIRQIGRALLSWDPSKVFGLIHLQCAGRLPFVKDMDTACAACLGRGSRYL